MVALSQVIILATGFEVQHYFAPLILVGRNGVNHLEEWRARRPSAYLGISAVNAPNYFFIGGPGTVRNRFRYLLLSGEPGSMCTY
jgi:cation diffusion facilitator CzcD-associated flavoprotein CzcO